ncbi:hypothetical protein [Streptomyces mirabilis]|uniref:hypothetical protein n=1 Tax=Streptomyces mirabilis TaxID=68239 RepID=UPI0033BC45DA
MRNRSSRGRILLAAIGAALLVPVSFVGQAHADSHQPVTGKQSGTRIVLGKPEKLKTVKPAAAPGANAVDCAEGTSVHDRTSSCSNYRIPVEFLVDGEPAGSAVLHSKATAQLDTRNRYQWKHRVELKLTDPTTPSAAEVSATVKYQTGHATASTAPTRILIPYVTQTFDFTLSSPGRDLVNDSIVPYGDFSAPGFDDGSAYLGETFRPRCDNTPRITPAVTGGCVYPDVPALWQIDVTDWRVDSVGWHVLWAQKNLAQPWGVKGTRYPLHRTFDQSLIADNRRTACGPDVPRPPRPGLACDEYPFAQSYEGASRNSDYSCEFLHSRDNSREGSYRKASLNGQRVLENDPFYVEVINVPATLTPQKLDQLRGPVGCGVES